MVHQLWAEVGAVVVVAVLALPGGIIAGQMPTLSHGPTTDAIAPAASHDGSGEGTAHANPASSVSSRVEALEQTLRARGVPGQDIHLPDLLAASPGRSGPVQPTYAHGPAPMGISDLGLRNESGTLQAYDYNTSSAWGALTIERAQSAYLDGDGPDTFSVQLNAVATNVTLFGTPGYQFWSQESAIYTSSTGALSLEDNVWNFSGPAASFFANDLAAHGPHGTPEPPVFYYAVGPTLTVGYPFDLSLYLNASRIDGRPAVYFNYSVTAPNATVYAGSFDYVEFNSGASSSGPPPAVPAFQVNGTGLGPSGLPNDLEFVLVGNGGGDTTTFFALNATMSLRYWNATAGAYEVVPAAVDAGSDTGETSNGVLPVYRTLTVGGPPVVSLTIGPSFVEGLWNVSTALDGARQFVVTQRPQNAFLFVSPGTSFNASEAQWVPTVHLFGATKSVFSIPNGVNETLTWLLSDRVPINYSVTTTLPATNSSTTLTETLTVNATYGAYTPLLAWGNGELAADSQGGNGTSGNPYILIHHPVGGLEPVFGQLNGFGFPVFAGVLLINTTDFVDVVEPQVGIAYGAWVYPQLSVLGLPQANSLQLEFWNVSNLVLLNSSDLTGWLASYLQFSPAGEVLFWGSSGDLVSRNTFYDQGVALALYGGRNNTIWGNTILAAAVEPSFDYGNSATGILEWESGDLIYNDYLAVPQPALTPSVDAVSCQTVCVHTTYVDTWDVPEEAANASTTVLGVVLTGSIVRTWYQGGNYWSNYGSPADPYGVLPYNDGGRITRGGDYVPLVVSTLYAVTFIETGLASGSPWNVTAFGVTTTSTTTGLVIYLPNGSYPYTVGAPTGYVGPPPAELAVTGANFTVPLTFDELFSQLVHGTGLASGWSWTVSFVLTSFHPSAVAAAQATSTGPNATVSLTNGTYDFTVVATGYTATPASGSVTVSGPTSPLDIRFTLNAILTVTASGLAAGTPWTVTVSQGTTSVNETAIGDGAIVFTALEIGAGGYRWSVSARNYTATPSSGFGASPGPTTEVVAFLPKPGPSSSPGVDWTVVAVGALAVLAIVGFALFVVERRRKGRAPTPMAPAPSAGVPSGTGTSPAPWEEGPGDTEKPISTRRP